MSHFVGFHIDYDGENVPVSTGETRDEAQSLAIRRVLSLGLVYGSIGIQEQRDLSDDEFAKLKVTLDEWFASKGVQ